MSSEVERRMEELLQRLVGDVERSVHAMYRGDVRQNTMRSRSDSLRVEARRALLELFAGTPAAGMPQIEPAPRASDAPPSAEEIAALRRCVLAWLPIAEPVRTSRDTRCVPVAREVAPSWGERELAREALLRMST